MFELDEIPFDHVIRALLDTEKPFPARLIYRLSDITPDEITSLKNTWSKVDLARRRAVMEDVQTMGEDDTLLDFSELGRLALKDPEGYIRQLAVRTLAEYEAVDLLPDFLYLVEHDADEQVRAACASALGTFVYLGEIEELSKKKLQKTEEILLRVHRGTDTVLVRRRALEALGYSSREEMIPLIEQAYAQGQREWLLSALIAMGRSSNAMWSSRVAAMLQDRRADVRAEAATAAGELGMRTFSHRLLELLEDVHEDVRAAAIWALSEVGGEGVRSRLEAMQEETEDEDEADLIESALENLSFTEDFQDFSMLELDEDEDEEDEYDEDEDFDVEYDEDEDEDEDRG
ncbi:MAG: HEAT repeat domain-containing protein [Anaerolineales bacterium]|nr:HEAT repeat domain-containing protein [Anaerolineales bacterium]